MPTTVEKFAKRGALKMYVGGDRNPRTRYNCAVIEAARANHVKILRLPGKYGDPRMLHRPNLLATFSGAHERSGEGKYVDRQAVSSDERKVTGAQHVVPYLAKDGSYRMIVLTHHNMLGDNVLGQLEANVEYIRETGTHLIWRGRRNQDGAILVTPWHTAEELYQKAIELNQALRRKLRDSQSPRPGVQTRLDSFGKFRTNLDVMRRASFVRNMRTGRLEEQGGATPCAMPMAQSGFSLDCAYLTTGFDPDGSEVGQYHYRMAYGRSIPWILTYEDWLVCTPGNRFAYKTDELRQNAASA